MPPKGHDDGFLLGLSTVETGCGPMRASETAGRLRHFATVFELML
jgi:hypothetical protein